MPGGSVIALIDHNMVRTKLLEAAKKTQNITGFLNRDMDSQQVTPVVKTNDANTVNDEIFTVNDVEIRKAVDTITKPNIMTTEDLEKSVKSLTNQGDINGAMTIMLNAYSTLAKAAEMNFENCLNIAETVDNNLIANQETSEELDEEIFKLSKNHSDYIQANENDKLEIKVKADIRHYKTQMIIYLKNDKILANCNGNDCIAITEKIINDQGLSLGRAYITKAIVLSGMKRINNINKFTKYIYVHFSDCFTSERLIMEMIGKNKKSSNKNNPDTIFTQPTSYDVNKIKRICHELQSDKSVSKVFLGDDSIKVTLNKDDPSNQNEKTRKVHVRNFTDLDKLRVNVTAKNHHIPSKIFYNKDYWQKKYPRDGIQKRKASDSIELDDPKKQKRFTNKLALQNDTNKVVCDDTQNSPSTSNSEM